MQGLFSTPKDIEIILNVCYQTAWEKYQVMKSAFGVEKKQKVKFDNFLQYFNITEQDYYKALSKIRN